MWDELYQQHLDECGFLFEDRVAMLSSLRFSLADLAEHDARLSAHLDGLAIGGQDAWRLCREGLERDEVGESFGAAYVALLSAGKPAAEFWEAFEARAEIPGDFVWALALQPENSSGVPDVVERLRGYAIDAPAPQRAAALRALNFRRVEACSDWAQALASESPDVQAAASEGAAFFRRAECAGRLGEIDAGLVPLYLLDPAKALSLARAALASGRAAPDAVRILGVHGDAGDVDRLGEVVFGGVEPVAREALLALANLGDAAAVSVFVRALEADLHPRVVGAALARVFGGLALRAREEAPVELTEEEEEELEWSEDDELVLPELEVVTGWWAAARSSFSSGQRLRYGAPHGASLGVQAADALLRFRADDALEAALHAPQRPLLETRGWARLRVLV